MDWANRDRRRVPPGGPGVGDASPSEHSHLLARRSDVAQHPACFSGWDWNH